MVPSRQGGAEAPRPTGGSPGPSIVHASGSAATREPRRYARRRGPWPPRGLPARPIHAPPGGTTGATRGPCAIRPGRGGRPGQGVPERAGGAARAGPGDGRPGLRTRGGAPARGCDPVPTRHVAGRAHADRRAREAPVPASPGPAAPRRTGRCWVAGTASRLSRPPSRPRSPATGRGPRPRGSPGPPTRGRPLTRPCARGAASHLGLAPSGGPGAESRRPGRIPGNGCALVRKLLIEGAWVLARGNPACRKRGGTPVPLAIREHARACSGRPLGRRRELVSRGPVLREANTATAAEMARMLLHVGRDAQEAAAPEEARCGPHELRYPRTWDCAPARRSRSGLPGRRCGSAIEG